MTNFLPCPYCGTVPTKTDLFQGGINVCCSTRDCAGLYFVPVAAWNTRAVNNSDAFDQYAASLQQEKQEQLRLIRIISELMQDTSHSIKDMKDPESQLNKQTGGVYADVIQIIESTRRNK